MARIKKYSYMRKGKRITVPAHTRKAVKRKTRKRKR